MKNKEAYIRNKSKYRKANTLQEVEDIYAPYKQKKRTRATIAKERGLEQLALDILNKNISNIDEEASKYINQKRNKFSWRCY